MDRLALVNIKTGVCEWVDIDDILFGHIRKEKLLFQTSKGLYQPISTIKDFIPLLKPLGFEQLEKSNIVNLNKISGYNETLKSVSFDNINANGGMLVSRRNKRKIKGVIKDR